MRVVFLFGRPSDVVLSTWRRAHKGNDNWGMLHFEHLHATGSIDDIVDQDALRIEEQIRAWRAFTDLPTLSIKYDALWSHRQSLEEFVGFGVPLPVKKQRRFDDMDAAIVSRVRQNYALLDKIVEALPCCDTKGLT